MADDDRREWSRQLHETGFCIAPGALDADLLSRLQIRFGAFDESDLTFDRRAETGAFLPMDLTDELTVEALTSPAPWRILADLGWQRPKLHSFYVSTKPPGSGALPWHCDVYYPAPEPAPTELFMLAYLHDTSPTNGCLRVVPRSHLSDDAMHAARHTGGPASAATRPDEVDVAVRAGDLIIADRRLLHATHPNRSGHWRTCLTIAVAPAFESLPENIRARIVTNPCLPGPGWWNDRNIDARLHPLLPRYDGNAEPVPID
ncbi:phytanoyl-CoA dioxygenase family protein [Plantactinospora sp. GCM10030261]|uniref:phytanoyl-CoA dioxygenase family protein n=1 Tax=Plantactinospora sp. GCM10030261 TaxID=3273420 RepID=UPI003605D4B7